MDERVRRVIYAMGYSASVITGRTSPAGVVPLAGSSENVMANSTSSSEPIMNEGMDTNAVVITMMTLSISLFR